MSAWSDASGDLSGHDRTSTGFVADGAHASDEYAGPLIDLTAMKASLRRRRKLWVSTALVGLFVGAAFHLVVPAKYAAVADLYMVEPAGSDPGQAIANDISLLQTRSVAAEAVADLHLGASPTAFLSTYQGTLVSDVIISIKLSAPSAARAVTYDNAVAKAFLTVRARELGLQTDLVVQGLERQVNALDAQIKDLTATISSLSTAPSNHQSANQVTQLVSERTGDASQISALQSQRQQDLLTEKAAAQGSRVLDPAAAVLVSAKKVLTMDGLSGLVAGLAIGLGIVIVGAVISDKPRRRSDVATALGIPVKLSVGPYHPPLFFGQWRLRRSLKRPGTTMQMIARRMYGNLGTEPGSTLAAVAIGPVGPAALGVASLSLWLASEGKRVAVVDMSEGRILSALFRAKARPGMCQGVAFNDRSFTLIIAPEDPVDMGCAEIEEVDSVLVLATVNPAVGADHIAGWATDAVAFVTAGEVTATRMTSSIQILEEAGITVRSAILVGATADDDSAGLVNEASRFPQNSSASDEYLTDGTTALTTELRRERHH